MLRVVFAHALRLKEIPSILVPLPLALCLFALSGCSHQDFGAPMTAPVTDRMDSGKPFVDRKTRDEVLIRAQRLAKVLAEWKVETPKDVAAYTVGHDDVLEIGVMNLEEPGKDYPPQTGKQFLLLPGFYL